MEIDYERLHRVKTARFHDRGDGRTFASCHDALMKARNAVRGTVLLWPVPRYDWRHHIKPMLYEMAIELGIPIQFPDSTSTVVCHHVRIMFICPRYWNELSGLEHYPIVNTYGEFFDYADGKSCEVWREFLARRESLILHLATPPLAPDRWYHRWLAAVRKWWAALVQWASDFRPW